MDRPSGARKGLPERLASRALAAAEEGFLELGVDGTVLAVDGAFAGRAEFAGNWVDLIAESDRATAEAALLEAIAGRPAVFEARSPGPTPTVWQIRLQRADGTNGDEATVLAVLKDVTTERGYQADLRKGARLRLALSKASSGMAWHLVVGESVSHRVGWEEFTGRAVSDAENAWIDLLHPDDRDHVLARVKHAVEHQAPYLLEYRLLHKSGDWHWVEDRAIPILGPDGSVTDWVGIIVDVQKRRTVEDDLKRSEQRLRVAIEATGLGTWDVEIATGLRIWSPELKEMLGLPLHTVPTETVLLACVHPDDRDAVARHNATTFLQPDGSPSAVFRIVRPDTGDIRWIRSQGRVVLDAEGRAVRRIGTFQDITEQHETRQALRRALRRVEALIATTSDIVWHADAEQGFGGGTGWPEFTGQTPERGQHGGWLDFVHPEDRERTTLTAREAIALGKPYTNEYRLLHRSGQWRWVEDRAVPLFDDDGRLTEWVGIITDVHMRKSAEAEIWRAAHTDDLTGLANRTEFQTRLDRAVAEADRTGQTVGLLLIDLDRFKEVNDSLGHGAGDIVLKSVGERLTDLLAGEATIARLGGDEFGVILPATTAERLAHTAAAVINALRVPVSTAERDLDCSASIGTSLYPDGDADPAALLTNADMALYAAKAAGRGRARAFDPAMRVDLDRRILMLRNARNALADGRIVAHYQPKVALSDGRVVGFEALLRWHDGTRLRTPDGILEAFGDYELAAQIGSAMISNVTADMAEWQAAGVFYGHVALNVAGPEFHRPGFVSETLSRLAASGIPPGRLEIEVTEGVLIETGNAMVAQALADLHAAGIVIGLDDFGTGFSSLTHLKRYPVSCLKIDRSFVANLETERDSAAIVQAVLGMARNLGIRAVAEGVETPGQLALLKEQGCDFAQGWFFSKPMAASRVPHFLATWQPEAALQGAARERRLG